MSFVLLRNLVLWERWGIFQLEAEYFSDSVIRVGDVFLGPGRVAGTCVCICAKDLVREPVLVLVEITSQIHVHSKLEKS